MCVRKYTDARLPYAQQDRIEDQGDREVTADDVKDYMEQVNKKPRTE